MAENPNSQTPPQEGQTPQTPVEGGQTPNQAFTELENKLKEFFKKAPRNDIFYVNMGYETIMPAVQIATKYYVYKIQLIENHQYLGVVDCARYKSRSGLTFHYCEARSTNNEWIPVSGLWIVNRNLRKLSLSADRKIFHKMEEVTFDIVPDWANLRVVGNHGYTFYEGAVKAPTLRLPLTLEQGHLELYNFTDYVRYYRSAVFEELRKENVKVVTSFEYYNHTLIFDKPVYKIMWKHLLLVPEDTKVVVKSPDHGEVSGTLRAGAYFYFHPMPAKRARTD